MEVEVLNAYHADPEDEAAQSALTWGVRSGPGSLAPAAFQALSEAFLEDVWGEAGDIPLSEDTAGSKPCRVSCAVATLGPAARLRGAP